MKYQDKLKLIFLELDGLFFQNFFDDLMSYAKPNFLAIKQKNDGGNDGFIKNEGIYFQVFSPESVYKSTVDSGASKIIIDFEKLFINWNDSTPIKKYIFVFNDKLKNSNKDLIINLNKLERKHNVITELYDSRKLISIFNENLTDHQKELIINKHTSGLAAKTAIIMASDILKNNLSISRWGVINNEYISFYCIPESDIHDIENLFTELFSMNFLEQDKVVIDELIKSLRNFISIFNTEFTRSFNGERQWDNSWKSEHYPHPKARLYDEELIKWEDEVRGSTLTLCRALNKFANYIRENYDESYLDYKDYTLLRRSESSLNEYVMFAP